MCGLERLYKLLPIRSAAAAITIAVASSHHSKTRMRKLFTRIKRFNFGKTSMLHRPWSTVSNRCGLNLCSSLTGLCGEDLLRLCDDCWTSQLHDTLWWGFISTQSSFVWLKWSNWPHDLAGLNTWEPYWWNLGKNRSYNSWNWYSAWITTLTYTFKVNWRKFFVAYHSNLIVVQFWLKSTKAKLWNVKIISVIFVGWPIILPTCNGSLKKIGGMVPEIFDVFSFYCGD